MSDRESANITKEKMTVLYVKPGEKPKRIEIENDLEALQRAVGGYIEAVYPYEDPVALIVNEEGKLNGLPLNRALRDEDNDIYDIVAGTFLVVTRKTQTEHRLATATRNSSSQASRL